LAGPAGQLGESLRDRGLCQEVFAFRHGHPAILAVLNTCELPAPGARRPERRFRERGARALTTAPVSRTRHTERNLAMAENLVVGLIGLGAGLLVGFGIALLVRRSFALSSETTARSNADRLLAEARTKQKEIILEAKDEALKVAKSAELENRERRAELQRYETRLDKKDEQLDT